MRRTVTWMVSASLALAALGCGGSGSGPTDTTLNTETPAAKVAQVTLSARFPGQDQAAKSLMDPRTNRILVKYSAWFGDHTTESVTLTPDSPTATVNLVPGAYGFTAEAQQVDDLGDEQSDWRSLDVASSSGTLVEGPNTVMLTFLAGSWTFVDAQGQAAAIELSSGAGSLLLDGFELRHVNLYPDQGPVAAAASEYMGEGGYVFTWGSRAVATPSTRFSDLSRLSGAYHAATFSGTANTSNFGGGWYNLTDGCGEFDPFLGYDMEEGGSMCSEAAGTRFIAVLGLDGDSEDGYSYDALLPEDTETQNGEPLDVSAFENGSVVSANRITGYLAEGLVVSSVVEIVRPAAQATKASAVALTDRLGALRALLESAGKAAQSSNTALAGITSTWSQHAIVCEDLNQDDSIDQGDWYLEYPVDVDGDGVTDAWEGGYLQADYSQYPTVLPGNPGECTTGLTLAVGGNPGEWVDNDQNGIIDSWELYDRDGDGTVDTGDIQLGHYLLYTEVLDAWLYPFAASGTPGTQGVFAFSNAFVQYRTFEDATNNRYQAFASVTLSGGPILESDIVNGTITGPAGALDIPDGNANYYRSRYLRSTWQAGSSQFDALVPDFDTGFSVNLSNYTTLPAGDYTVTLETAFGTTVSATVNLPSTVELPVVASSSMTAAWETDGSLTFSWTEPPTGTFDQYRLVMTMYDMPFFYGRIAPGISSITIPAAQIAEFEATLPSYIDAPTWQMQTRNYTGNHNYARGVSAQVPVPDQQPQ